jgi:ribokinase
MARQPRVAVLGSLNMDISVSVGRLPRPGETILGDGAVIAPGGKGANQAVAAARLGAEVRLAGCVGDDEFGGLITAALRAEKVGPQWVRTVPGLATGLALITVDATGENMITVAPGANGQCGPQEAAAVISAPADMLVISAEIPATAIAQVLAAARQQGLPCLLNLAPVPAGAAQLLATGVDWLVVNESEASALLGREVAGLAEAARAAVDLRGLTNGAAEGQAARLAEGQAARLAAGQAARYAVVTAGSHGAALAGPDGADLARGFSVRSVDSVGAGDAFVAALAVAVAAGAGPADALRLACAAGATATTTRGTQAALPRSDGIRAATGLEWPLPS